MNNLRLNRPTFHSTSPALHAYLASLRAFGPSVVSPNQKSWIYPWVHPPSENDYAHGDLHFGCAADCEYCIWQWMLCCCRCLTLPPLLLLLLLLLLGLPQSLSALIPLFLSIFITLPQLRRRLYAWKDRIWQVCMQQQCYLCDTLLCASELCCRPLSDVISIGKLCCWRLWW